MPINVVFSGSHSTGKTTLANNLVAANPSRFTVVTNIARSIIREGFPLGEKATVDSYVALLGARLEHLRDSVKLGSEFVVWDRAMLDTYAYELTNQETHRAKKNTHLLKLLREASLLELNKCEHLFYLPIEFQMVEDGVRLVDPAYRDQVDQSIAKTLKDLRVSYTEVTGDSEQRLELVTRKLGIYRGN